MNGYARWRAAQHKETLRVQQRMRAAEKMTRSKKLYDLLLRADVKLDHLDGSAGCPLRMIRRVGRPDESRFDVLRFLARELQEFLMGVEEVGGQNKRVVERLQEVRYDIGKLFGCQQ